jgi:steroid delta-isomerase
VNTPPIDRIASFFERLAPSDLEHLHTVYCEDAFFKDPFNEVTGLDAIRKVYTHMFDALERPRFVVTQRMQQGTEGFLLWEFHFRSNGLRNPDHCIRGATHVRLAPDGRIAMHRDYWDPAEELYEAVPVLGAFMRWLKRRARTP